MELSISARNENSTAFTIETGRIIFDTKGNQYRVETPAIITANNTATFEAVQLKTETISHTIAGSYPFYAIELPESEDGSFLSAISVRDQNGKFEYRERYVNTWANERIYHVESDDRQRVYVRFGQADIVGRRHGYYD